MTFSDGESAFLSTQRLGRLATVDGDGAPQNNPVGFFHNPETGTIDIGGHALGGTRKFRNVQRHPQVSLVIDELASTQPWVVRGIEIRGRAETLTGQEPPMPGFSGELIRIHPRQIFSWGLDADISGMQKRTVS